MSSADWKVQHCENSDRCRFNAEIDDEFSSDYKKLEHSVCRGSNGCRDYLPRKNTVR